MRNAASLGRLVLGICVAGAMGCTASAESAKSSPPGDPGDPHDAPPAKTSEARSSKTREASPAVPSSDLAELTQGEATFAAKLYGELRKSAAADDNIFFSPQSIYTAFGLLQAGARTTTEAEIAATMSYPFGSDRLHAAMNKLDLELASRADAAQGGSGSDGKGFRLAVANSAWAQQGFPFEAPYLDTLAVDYGAGVGLVDFIHDSPGATSAINLWIEGKTEGRIAKMLSGLSTDTRLVLVNAVYFNAAWQMRFAPEATAPAAFAAPSGAVTIPTMNGPVEGTSMRRGHTDAFDAVAVPYEGGNVELVAVMPAAGTFDAFEGSWSAARYEEVLASMSSAMVRLSMPRFKVAPDTFSLKPALSALGMHEPFESSAHFEGISTTPLFVFDVAHKAFVKVDENGTEAAAATAIIAGVTSVPPPAVEVKLDRPFLYFIRDVPTGAVLFAGRLAKPE